MLKASALYIVLIISVLLASLCLSVILLSFYYRKEMVAYDIEQKLIANASSGVKILLAEKTDSRDERILDLFGEETDTIILKSSLWGVFETGIVEAVSGNKNLKKTFLFGYKPANETQSCLYAVDNNRPVNLSGKTILKGLCYLPESGLQRGYIGSRTFEGSTLFDGQIKKSGYQLYPASKEIFENLKNLLNGNYDFPVKKNQLTSLENQELTNSFSDSTVCITGSGIMQIRGRFKGNIMITSSEAIKVYSDAILKDVILIAPRIYLEDNFDGTLQAFASDTIIAGNKVKLNYPSVLGLIQHDTSQKGALMRLKEDCVLKGQIFSFGNQSSVIQPRIITEKGSRVEGQVYSSGYLQVAGSVHGHTAAGTLSVYTGGFTYDNYLLDAVFDYSKLDDHFVSSALFPVGDKKLLIKWID
jgi:cytoskeletal protein CcmA (bactofilin family)